MKRQNKARRFSKGNITLIIAVIGSLAWIPSLIDWFAPSNIYGKITTSFLSTKCEYSNDSTKFDVLLLSLTVKNKDFALKEINVYAITNTGQEKFLEIAECNNFPFSDSVQDGIESYSISLNNYLNLNRVGLLQKGTDIKASIAFKHPISMDKVVKYKIVFNDYDDHMKNMTFDIKEIVRYKYNSSVQL
jgi:hypothetical protein